jgi:hypothetical protein
MKRIPRKICFVIGLLVAFHMNIPAQAQVAVWDPEEIARLAEKSARMAEALSRAVELLNNIDVLSRTIGRFGPLPNLDFTHFDLLDGLKGAGPEISGFSTNITAAQHVKIDSFNDAKAFVDRLVTVPSDGYQITGVGQSRQALDSLYRKALEDGYALSMHTRASLSNAPQRARLLVAQASAATDLRGDVGANTASSLAIIDQLGSLKTMLASSLEILATRRLVSLPDAMSKK